MQKESKLQSKIIKTLEKSGYFCIKIIVCNKNGIPDIVALRDGVTIFIEVKTEKGVESPIQKIQKQRLINKKFEVKTFYNYGEFEIWFYERESHVS